ncbi:MAG TPA: NUDIX pyrophosphatase [Gemmatimonadales bacterium]|nr:NUDIX pyrophosphatase [Gemmatimonadales bacterium]
MTRVAVAFVDLYVLRPGAAGMEVLVLRRGPGGRCPGSWESVHGHIEPGERPADTALRELREEAGLVPDRLYNLSRVEAFYQHQADEVALIPVFVALVGSGAQARLSAEHDAFEWLPPEGAAQRVTWPRERRAIADAIALLGAGDAGPAEDVLRIC